MTATIKKIKVNIIDFDSSSGISNGRKIIDCNIERLVMYTSYVKKMWPKTKRTEYIQTYNYLKEYLCPTSDFCIKITDIKEEDKSGEVLKGLSELYGLGLSVIITDELFNVNSDTISQITNTGKKRMDWECKLQDGRTILVEAKGTIDNRKRDRQRQDAIEKKRKTHREDLKIASLALLKENDISDVEYRDPLINNMEKNINNIDILRATHYINAFSFLGNMRIARYFMQMRKRLSNNITPDEMQLKNREFLELKYNFPSIKFNNSSFSGFFYKIDKKNYMFFGIDKRLLSYKGFKDYKNNEGNIEENINNNKYVLYRDGILVIEISNIGAFKDLLNIETIKHYQEDITMSDIDNMSEISFVEYIKYVIDNKIKGITNIEKKGSYISFIKDSVKYIIKCKILKYHKNNNMLKDKYFEKEIKDIKENFISYNVIMITNIPIEDDAIIDSKNVVILDRKKIIKIIKEKKYLDIFDKK